MTTNKFLKIQRSCYSLLLPSYPSVSVCEWAWGMGGLVGAASVRARERVCNSVGELQQQPDLPVNAATFAPSQL